MELTQEQQRVVDHEPARGGVLKVIAFAGTGKTTTLVAYTKKRPKLRFLYLAFNKSVQLSAEGKFPSNVTAKTAHGLAFRDFGAPHRLRLAGNLKAHTAAGALGLTGYTEARYAIGTLLRYMASADTYITEKHIPPQAFERRGKALPNYPKMAGRLWELMLSGEDPRIGMLHDGYLKLYQLAAPRLNFDCILLDEAQDVSPVITEIVRSQSCAKILVGDPHQQIYSFRGARDAMAQVAADHTFYLTHSFRFGGNIARAANMVLSRFKGEERRLVGLRKGGRQASGHTLIARTNAAVFDEAVKLQGKKRIAFVGGIEGYRFSAIQDGYNLSRGRRDNISDPFLAGFTDFAAMKSYAKQVEDWELSGVSRVVEKYEGRIPQLVRRIEASVADEAAAEVVLTTAHKAKGLEFDNVSLADDFPRLLKEGELIAPTDLDPDEFNLIYVAITRAKERLQLFKGSDLAQFILKVRSLEAREKQRRPNG